MRKFYLKKNNSFRNMTMNKVFDFCCKQFSSVNKTYLFEQCKLFKVSKSWELPLKGGFV